MKTEYKEKLQELILSSYDNQAQIICSTPEILHQIMELAKEMDFDIIVPLTYKELHNVIDIKGKHIIDNTDGFLQFITDRNHRLPSRFAINDPVTVDFEEAGKIKNCRVIKVHFTESKVLYDIEVTVLEGYCTRIYNIDSVFVYPVEN